MKRLKVGLVAVVLVALFGTGATLAQQSNVTNAVVIAALQAMGLFGDGYADGEVPIWTAAAQQFQPGTAGGGFPLLAPAANNCASVPYSFTSDTNTGLCSEAADEWNLYAGGVNALQGTASAVTSAVPILIGSNPAPATVGIGLTNDQGITYRQAGGAGNYLLLKGDGSNNIIFGDTSSSDILVARTMRPSGSGATTSDIGNATDPWRIIYAGRTGLVTTSTDGFVALNATAATGGATVQISPRSRWSGTGWDSDDSVSRTVSFFSEVLPVSGATVSGSWKLGYIDPVSSAITYPLTVSNGGAVITLTGSSGGFWGDSSGDAVLYRSGAGTFRTNASVQIDSSLSFATLAVSVTAATVANGCTGEAMVWNNRSFTFEADMGTSCTGVSTVVFTLPAAVNGWACFATNQTTAARNVEATAWATTSVTFTNFDRTTGLATDWVDGDNVRVLCGGG